MRAPRASPASAVDPLGTFDSRSQGLREQEERDSARSIVKQTVELNGGEHVVCGGYQKRTALWGGVGREVRPNGRANVPLIPGAVCQVVTEWKRMAVGSYGVESGNGEGGVAETGRMAGESAS